MLDSVGGCSGKAHNFVFSLTVKKAAIEEVVAEVIAEVDSLDEEEEVRKFVVDDTREDNVKKVCCSFSLIF